MDRRKENEMTIKISDYQNPAAAIKADAIITDIVNRFGQPMKGRPSTGSKAHQAAGYALRQLKDLHSYLSAAAGFAGEVHVIAGLQPERDALQEMLENVDDTAAIVASYFGIDYSEYES